MVTRVSGVTVEHLCCLVDADVEQCGVLDREDVPQAVFAFCHADCGKPMSLVLERKTTVLYPLVLVAEVTATCVAPKN